MYTVAINGNNVARFRTITKAIQFGRRVAKAYKNVKLKYIKG